MISIKIYGQSDDLIEVEGDLSDEFYAHDGPNFVELSTGDVLCIYYGADGIWRIDHQVDTNTCDVHIETLPDEFEDDDPDPYTEIARILGPIEWVDCWDEWPVSKRCLINALEIADLGARMEDLSTDTLKRIWAELDGRSFM